MGNRNFLTRIMNRIVPSLSSVGRYFGIGYLGGTKVSSDNASKVSAYYRGVTYLSTQLAKLPIHIKDSKNVIDERSNVAFLLNVQPNPETTAFAFKNYLFRCAIDHGCGYAEIERDLLGRPVNLWQIDPSRVTPIRQIGTNKLFYRIDGNEFGNHVILDPKDILIIRNMYSRDGITAESTINFAAEVLGISLGADKFANSLYANGTMPSGVLTAPQQLSDEAYSRLKDSWNDSMKGGKVGGTVILEDGVKYEAISHSPANLQFIETRKFNVLEIARFLGVPPIKLFDMDSAKYGNMEQVQLEVATDVLDAWARNIESEVDIKLLSKRHSNKRCELDIHAVFRGDMSTRSTYFTKMMQSASMTPNEIRVKEGLAPYEGGDRFYIATNNFSPVDRVDELLNAQITSKQPTEPTESSDESENDVEAMLKGILERYDQIIER